MTRNEFIVQTAKMILDDWRKTLLANSASKNLINMPGDTVDISYRAFQKAEEIAKDFFN